MADFPCTKCGACCRRAWALAGALPTKPDGSCMHLNADNSCAIYATRPDICRVKDQFAANAAACNRFQEADGLPTHFRVIVKE